MKKMAFTLAFCLCAGGLFAGWEQGIPVAVMKSDYGVNVIFIQLEQPIQTYGCESGIGLVVRDSHPSSKAALPMAMAALVSGKKFRCYVDGNDCSRTTGANTTFPVCAAYHRCRTDC